MCGEQPHSVDIKCITTGSSPRVRGTETRGGRYHALGRFIPACAGNRKIRSAAVRLTSVHPRVCGEQDSGLGAPGRRPGSSPRVRGTAFIQCAQYLLGRFIPACAGNRSARLDRGSCLPVHPRVCGEQADHCSQNVLPGGSSPRVRGTVCPREFLLPRRRFIPACAGNSFSCAIDLDVDPVHPRVCGEQPHAEGFCLDRIGSSPRVRGTGPLGCVREDLVRFIPACAGNRFFQVILDRVQTVHPRVCGEQPCFTRRSIQRFGSSPRVRGTGGKRDCQGGKRRFIPACAGNRPHAPEGRTGRPVHPRVCGEQRTNFASDSDGAGSSPRVRGTDQAFEPPINVPRFIPACAGNRFSRLLHSTTVPVHPRVCGEQPCFTRRLIHFFGSSPRVRGTDNADIKSERRDRFIPACAGNSADHSDGATVEPVHPRVCGEQVFGNDETWRVGGSSPRVRGTESLV